MPDDRSEAPEPHAARADPPRYPVEAAYTPPGPYATTTSTVTDGAGNAIYDLFYPADYAALGFKSPIVTWGNGTDSTPPQYTTFLSHLASYGFSVIGTTSQLTKSGVDVDDAAHYLAAQAGTAGSVFYGSLDVSRIAAVGHSQGAGGATRAALNDPALITTLMTFSLPVVYWLNGPSIAGLTQPAFLISTHGIWDSVVAPPVIERIYYETINVPRRAGHHPRIGRQARRHASILDPAYGGDPGGELADRDL
jgi:pimeloyl-ACP methyl ester carboxylesterase